MYFYIEEKNWQIIYKILQNIPNIRVNNEQKTRQFLENIQWVLKTGAQWRALPDDRGNWRSVHKRFLSWSDNEVFEKILKELTKDCDIESIMLDGTIVRAHACSAGYKKDSQAQECLGRSKGGFTTKIHMVVDALGQALKFAITPGNRNEITKAKELIDGFYNTNVIADKGYDSNEFVKQIEKQQCVPVIPSRSNRKIKRVFDEHLYVERHLIECFFGKLKHFRRIFSRFEKTAKAFSSLIAYASIIIWLR
jgi:transposase